MEISKETYLKVLQETLTLLESYHSARRKRKDPFIGICTCIQEAAVKVSPMFPVVTLILLQEEVHKRFRNRYFRLHPEERLTAYTGYYSFDVGKGGVESQYDWFAPLDIPDVHDDERRKKTKADAWYNPREQFMRVWIEEEKNDTCSS